MTNERKSPHRISPPAKFSREATARRLDASERFDPRDISDEAEALTLYFCDLSGRWGEISADLNVDFDLFGLDWTPTSGERRVIAGHLVRHLTKVYEDEGYIRIPLDDLFSIRRIRATGRRFQTARVEDLVGIERCRRLVKQFVATGRLDVLERGFDDFLAHEQAPG